MNPYDIAVLFEYLPEAVVAERPPHVLHHGPGARNRLPGVIFATSVLQEFRERQLRLPLLNRIAKCGGKIA